MADKTDNTAPATGTAAPVNDGHSDGSGKAAAAAPAPELTALQTELQRERDRRIESERNYQNLHSAYGKQSAELGTLRSLRDTVLGGGASGDTSEETASGVDESVLQEVANTREELAWLRFQQAHPHYREWWDEMKQMAGDPIVKRTIETYRVVGGRPVLDTYATLHNAYNEVKIRHMEKAQVDTATRKAEADAKAKENAARATISGSGASSAETTGIDDLSLEELMALDYNELIKRIPVNPNDPPRGI